MSNSLVDKKETKFNSLTIYYANELARKYCKFSLEEQKVLHLIFSQIKPYEKNPTTFKIEKIDFFKKLNLKGDDKYRNYNKLLKNLINKSVIEIDDEIKTSVGVVIYNVEWYKKESYFFVKLNPDFMPYLEQLVRDYTKVNLDSVLKLKSKHSLTLYKWLCSWTDESKKINQRYITTKDLKELFGLSIDDYAYNGKFRRFDFERETIKKAINEINKISNINVFFKKIKENGKVKNYEFTWTKKDKSNTDNHTKQNANKCQSLNDMQTQLLLDNIDGN